MIPSQQTQINWTEIGVIVGGISLALVIVGWFVSHSLTKSREKVQRKERIARFISDFEVVINKWTRAIHATHIPRNQVWTITLNGGMDRYASALDGVRTQSIDEMDSYMRAIRACLSATGQSRLDKAWQDYQNYNIEGIEGKDPATGEEFTSHTECKKGLIDCLEQMKQIAQLIEI